MTVLLGCIADDFTGATDLCSTLVEEGMRVVQLLGVPDEATHIPQDVDVLVVALKSRSIDPRLAVQQSLAALAWLRRAGAKRCFFKYCSTFDSTPQGNIGPVAVALLRALGSRMAVACPAFPENARTVYQGHLFVGSELLSESGMERHPLNPMTDANLVRWLERQAHDTDGGAVRVGLVPLETVGRGASAVRARLRELEAEGFRLAVADAVSDADLRLLAAACAEMPLITGGSGMALGLPNAYRELGLLPRWTQSSGLPRVDGRAAVFAGSCSAATLRQITRAKADWPAYELPVERIAAGEDAVVDALAWALAQPSSSPLLLYASADASRVRAIQDRFGREQTCAAIEQTLAEIAHGLVQAGFRRLVVAGGETSGAIVSRLGVKSLRIGPRIDPGVPWTESLEEPRLALALKSGNFGGEDFFLKALEMLP